MMRAMLFSGVAVALLLPAHGFAQTQRGPSGQGQEWRPEWAKELPKVPPAGTLGIQAFAADRQPCSVQLYIGNATETTVRNVWGVVLLQPGAIVGRFHASYISIR